MAAPREHAVATDHQRLACTALKLTEGRRKPPALFHEAEDVVLVGIPISDECAKRIESATNEPEPNPARAGSGSGLVFCYQLTRQISCTSRPESAAVTR